jgi:hypothetical protein
VIHTPSLGYFEGPIPLTKCEEMTRELIHSPFANKLQTCENIELVDVTLRPDINVDALSGYPVDEDALQLMETIELPGDHKCPLLIEGDGNCLPRCGSMIVYGTEECHRDIRLRIAIELVQFQHLYLSDKYLARGWPSKQLPKPTALSYVQYSEYWRKKTMNEMEICHIFNKEVNAILANKAYMGIWQLFGLASVLGCPVVSVHPAMGSAAVQRDFHRLILPRQLRSKTPRFVMWSTGRSMEMVEEHWVANHFVLLVPFTEEFATLEKCKAL